MLTIGTSAQATLWSPPEPFLPANVSNAQDWRVVFAPDDLSFYLLTERDGHFADTQIYRSTRSNVLSPWGTPSPVPELNTGNQDHIYWISQDQTEAFMARHGNPVPNTFGDIYRSTRASPSNPWGSPTIVSELSGPSTFEWHFNLTADGLNGVFSSTRPGGAGGFDLWQTSRADRNSPWTAPSLLSVVNSAANERGPYLSADGLTLFFNRFGIGLFSTTRASIQSSFTTPISLGINGLDPTLSPDGRTLYYTMPNGSDFNYDVYFSVPEPATAMLLMIGVTLLSQGRAGRRRT